MTVDGRIALAALIALGDGHLQHLAKALQLLATSEAARSGDWEQIKGPLGEVGQRHIPGLNWFALPDGSYWSVQEGRATGNLATRPYFPRVLAGNPVLGELVVSHATGKSVAIIAVPIIRPDHAVIGVLGSSVYLDQLSTRLQEELGLADLPIFYAFDATPLLALVYDADLIFPDPAQLGEDVDGRLRRCGPTSRA